MNELHTTVFTIGKQKIKVWMVIIGVVVSIATWMIAEALTPEFTTTEFLSGFHINHSFVGVVIILFGAIIRKKMPPVMFIVLLSVGFTMIVHDGVIFRELGIIQGE